MARPKSDHPAYLLHKQSGRARIIIDGCQRLLPGKFGSPESRAEYDRLVGSWVTNGRVLPAERATPAGPTVTMIVLAFWKPTQAFYVDADGSPTGEADNFRLRSRSLDAAGPKHTRSLAPGGSD